VAGPKDKKRRERKREGKKKKKKRGQVGWIPSRAEPDENEMGCALVILACELFSFFSGFYDFLFQRNSYLGRTNSESGDSCAKILHKSSTT
jgi:hypothetical protein